jgi:hypothetical protein
MFVGTTARTDVGVHVYLPSVSRDLPPLDAATQLQIKDRFQPWYLWHRLSSLPAVQQSGFAGGVAASVDEVDGLLQICSPNGRELRRRWAPLLRMQEQDARAQRYWDPLTAMLEVLWPRLHSAEKSITIKELTGLTNTLLRSRGELREYSPEEFGIKLGNEGVLRRRRSSGMVLMFDRQTLHRLHQLTRGSGVGKREPKCLDCKG